MVLEVQRRADELHAVHHAEQGRGVRLAAAQPGELQVGQLHIESESAQILDRDRGRYLEAAASDLVGDQGCQADFKVLKLTNVEHLPEVLIQCARHDAGDRQFGRGLRPVVAPFARKHGLGVGERLGGARSEIKSIHLM